MGQVRLSTELCSKASLNQTHGLIELFHQYKIVFKGPEWGVYVLYPHRNKVHIFSKFIQEVQGILTNASSH